MGEGGVNEVTACAVHYAFWHASGAGCVENEQRVFSIHFFRRANVRSFCGESVVIEISAIDPSNVATCALHHQTFHTVVAVCERKIRVGFKRRCFAAARRLVCGDQQLCLRAVYACCQSIRRKACKNNRVDCADPRACEHRVGRFWDHRNVQNDTVAFANAHILKNISHAVYIGTQLVVTDVLRGLFGIVGLKNDRRLIAARCKVAVDAIGSHIQCAIGVPIDIDVAKAVIDVFHFCKGLDPIDPCALLFPKRIWIRDGGRVHRFIFGAINMCILGHVGGRGESIAHGIGSILLVCSGRAQSPLKRHSMCLK